jgi:spermidine synthase
MPRWPFALYAMTGFAGLLAEQGFEKYVTLLTGATASGAAVVIFSYFLGFAGGSALAGAFLERGAIRTPLRTYGALELLVGLSCIAFTFGFHHALEVLAPLQAEVGSPVTKFLARFAFGSILILPTATLMGASFPLIAHVVDRDDASGGQRWTRAYAANLAGACVAALLGPYVLLPVLGVRGAMWLCLLVTVFVFAVTRLLPDAPAVRPDQDESVRGGLDTDAWLLLVASFASGAVFFVSEVLWTHLVGAVLGTSVYAFSSMLLMVLLGLLLGARRAQRGKTWSVAFLLQCCALVVLVQFRMWDVAQLTFRLPGVPGESFYLAESVRLLVAAVLIVPSATMLGTIFPSLLRSPILRKPGRSWLLALMNTANALGCLSGALLGLFVMIPLVGSEASLKIMVVLLTAGSLVFLWRARPSRAAVASAVALASLTLFFTAWWRWDRALLTSGLNIYFGRRVQAPSREPREQTTSRMLYFREAAQGGITTVVESTVVRDGDRVTTRTLLTNGKFEGNDASEAQAQSGVSVVPSQFVPGFRRALLIGLGTGHSAFALKQLGYEEVDVAEFAPGIVEAAATYFAHLNHGVLADPSVRLVLEDGRNVLLTAQARAYDLITTEITSIWFAGATNVYAKEFYELAKRRMMPGAVLQQWVQLHTIGRREIASAIATARTVFRYVSLWHFGGQGMIIATDHPQELTPARRAYLVARLGDEDTIARVSEARLLDPEGVDAMIGELDPVINTDHNRWIEYATPRYNASSHDWRTENLEFFARR